jgi:hypothetical protein
MTKKYHKEHPTISFRCESIEEYNKIKRMVEISGKSESTFIREILLKAEIKESKSYIAGLERAVNTFIIPCSICGKKMLLEIDRYDEIRQKIIDMFGDYAHFDCNKNQQQNKS